MEYTFRKSALDKATTVTVDDEAIYFSQETGKAYSIPYSSVRSVKLKHVSNRYVTDIFQCSITSEKGRTLHFTNKLYKGILDFEDQSHDFNRLVKTLHDKLAPHPQVKFIAGLSTTLYWFYMVFVIGILLLLGYVLFTFFNYINGIIIAKLVVTIYFTILCYSFFKRNKPQVYTADNIPTNVLPKGGKTE